MLHNYTQVETLKVLQTKKSEVLAVQYGTTNLHDTLYKMHHSLYKWLDKNKTETLDARGKLTKNSWYKS